MEKKVPEITILFWGIKLLTTAMGEGTSDYLVHQYDPKFAVVLGGIGFSITLLLQFFVKRYIPRIYWLCVVMVAIFGTMVADVLHIGLGVPYIASAILFFISLILVFFIWKRSEKTLSIHSITTRKREVFYWLTVVTTFAFGTALGDLTASTLHMGYLLSGLLFLLLFLLPTLAYKYMHMNEIATFWIAYILTRPLGASFADWFGKPLTSGGLGIGSGQVSLLLAFAIGLLVWYETKMKRRFTDE